VRHDKRHFARLWTLLALAPLIAGCSGAGDLISRDAEWFSRPGRLFIRNVSIDAPPLNPNTPVTAEDLVSAEGACPGMPAPGGAQALADGPASAPAQSVGAVALGHTECDVVRGLGAPDRVDLHQSARRAPGRRDVDAWQPARHLYFFRRTPEFGGTCA
jgi:hypothetical protein